MYSARNNSHCSNLDYELTRYLGPYEQPLEELRYQPDYCPICGEEIRFGQHCTEGPNGYWLHTRCYEVELHRAAEEDLDVSDPRGEWLSDAIEASIIDRGEQYDTEKYPQLWMTEI